MVQIGDSLNSYWLSDIDALLYRFIFYIPAPVTKFGVLFNVVIVYKKENYSYKNNDNDGFM